MNDLLRLVLLLGIGGVAVYFVYKLSKSSGLGSGSDLTSDDSETPGGGGGCMFPRICDASGQPTGAIVADANTGIESPLSSGATDESN